MIKDNSISVNDINIYIKKPKNRVKIWIYSLRKNALSIVFCIFTICLVVFSKSNLVAAKNGLVLWATAVVPSLFPFFVANEMLSYTNVVSYLGKLLNPIMHPLFGVPGEGAFAFIMGLISGYPVGAKIVSNFMEQGICTKEEAERMLAFTNNSGPLFIIGTVGITLFGNTSIGVLLFITHVLACVTVGIVLNILSLHTRKSTFINNKQKSYKAYYNASKNHTSSCKNTTNSNNSNIATSPSFSSLGEILGKSITNSISTILMIGGFVVIFSVIISILNTSNMLGAISSAISPVFDIIGIPAQFVKPILSGIIELTNGVSLVASLQIGSISTNIILCAFLLGFGGISVLLQVFSIISKASLSIKKYTFGKLLQGIFAAIYTIIALRFFPIL